MCFLACRHRNSDCTGLSLSVCAVIYHWVTWNDSAVKLGHFLFRWIWFHMKGSSSTQDMSRSTISIVLVKCMYSSYLFFIFFKESDWRFKRGSDQILYLQCKQLSRLAAKHHTVRSRWQSLYTSLFSEQRHIFTATKLFSIKHASAHIQCKHPPPPPRWLFPGIHAVTCYCRHDWRRGRKVWLVHRFLGENGEDFAQFLRCVEALVKARRKTVMMVFYLQQKQTKSICVLSQSLLFAGFTVCQRQFVQPTSRKGSFCHIGR